MNQQNKPLLIKIIIMAFVFGTNGIKNNRHNNNNNNNDEEDVDMNDMASLSELPIEKLLMLRQTLKHETPLGYGDFNRKQSKPKTDNEDGDDTYGIKENRKTGWEHGSEYEHHGHGDDNMLWKKAKGNIQTIFQTTVTVLAFLAFGGYLICLIVMTVKGNNQQGQVVVQTMTSSTTTRNRRRRRYANGFQMRNDTLYATSMNDTFDPGLYALCQIADGYTKYHTLTPTYEEESRTQHGVYS